MYDDAHGTCAFSLVLYVCYLWCVICTLDLFWRPEFSRTRITKSPHTSRADRRNLDDRSDDRSAWRVAFCVAQPSCGKNRKLLESVLESVSIVGRCLDDRAN